MKILIFPKDNNPYQDFLYKNFDDKKDTSYEYLYYKITDRESINLCYLLLIILWKRITGADIFHLHFTYIFNLATDNKILKALSKVFYSIYIIVFISFIKILGYKLVWTLHDIKPHYEQTINDLLITKFIIHLSDRVIVHSKNSIDLLKKYKISTTKVAVIPIGNYNNYYENKISKSDTRKKLGLSQEDFVYLFFGLIKEYKGIEDLLIAFNELKIPNAKLLIVGNSYDEDLKKKIIDAARKNKNIQHYIKFIPDKDIQIYLNACDIVVLPYRRLTTSSSTLLAFAFHKPIIFPRTGDLNDLPSTVGFSYEANNVKDLLAILMKVYKNKTKLKLIGDNAYEYSRQFDWEKISEQTYKIYQSEIPKEL